MHCSAHARFIDRKMKILPLPAVISSIRYTAKIEVIMIAREVRMRKRDWPEMNTHGDSTICKNMSDSVGGMWPVTWPRSGVLSFIADQQHEVKIQGIMAAEEWNKIRISGQVTSNREGEPPERVTTYASPEERLALRYQHIPLTNTMLPFLRHLSRVSTLL